jgi:hypothetical protein
VPMCIADLEACLDRVPKKRKCLLRAIALGIKCFVVVEGYSLGYNFLVLYNELH